MFKLLKYEMRKTMFMKMAIFVFTLICEVDFLLGLLVFENGIMLGTGALGLLICGYVGMLVCGLQSINTLHHELNSKQSYMLFMTPNSGYKILGAKTMENFISLIIAGVFFGGIASLDLISFSAKEVGLLEFVNQFLKGIGVLELNPQNIFLAFLFVFLEWLSFITIAFLAVIIQSTFLNGRKMGGVIGFVIFLIISAVFSYGHNLLSYVNISDVVNQVLLYVYVLLVTVICYMIGGWLMEKKLSV